MEMSRDGRIEGQPLPWGFWATTGFTCLIITASLATETFAALAYYATIKALYPDMRFDPFRYEGLLIGLLSFINAPVVIGLTLFFARLRKNISIKEYFCLFNTGKDQYIKWFLLVLVLAFCSDAITIILEKPIVPDVMAVAYESARFKSLLWFAMVVVSPLTEEIVFRGFVFKGIQASPLGPIGAILISASGWAALHSQYDLYGVATIFVGGLALGIARHRTNSIFIPIMMHSLANFVATVETAVYASVIQV